MVHYNMKQWEAYENKSGEHLISLNTLNVAKMISNLQHYSALPG